MHTYNKNLSYLPHCPRFQDDSNLWRRRVGTSQISLRPQPQVIAFPRYSTAASTHGRAQGAKHWRAGSGLGLKPVLSRESGVRQFLFIWLVPFVLSTSLDELIHHAKLEDVHDDWKDHHSEDDLD